MGMLALVVPVDETVPMRVIEWPTDASRSQLEVLYRQIGCSMVEIATLRTGPSPDAVVVAWMDEEGLLNSATMNRRASYLGALTGHHSPFFGNVVLTRGADEVGETIGMTASETAMFMQVCDEYTDDEAITIVVSS